MTDRDAEARAYRCEELALIALLLAFFVAIVVLSAGIPFDARLFPWVVGGAGILLMLAVALEHWRKPRADASDAADNAAPGRLALALAAAPAFGLVFWLAGFVVASLVAMLVLPPLLGYRDRKRLVLIAVVTVAALALVAPYLLNVDLPHGLLGDWLIDRLSSRAG